VGAGLEGDDATRLRLARALLAGTDDLSLGPPGRFPADREADRRATLELLAGELDRVLEVVRTARDETQDAWLRVLARWPDGDGPRILAALDARGEPLTAAALEAWTTHARPGDPRATERARSAARSQDPAMRLASARLAAIVRSEPLLVLLLQDAWPPIRGLAAQALGRLGALDEGTIKALAEASRDPDPTVAVQAARSLAAAPNVGRELIQRLEAEGAWEVRRALRGGP